MNVQTINRLSAVSCILFMVLFGISEVSRLNSKLRIVDLENKVSVQEATIRQKDAVLTSYKAQMESLLKLAQHTEEFERNLSMFMVNTNTQLKKVLDNDEDAKRWGAMSIPPSLLQLHKDSYSSADSISGTSNR